MHPERGLEVVSPKPLSPARIAQLLELHRPWIERHLPAHEPWPRDRLPADIQLHALDQRWSIVHAPGIRKAKLRACHAGRVLHVEGSPVEIWPLLHRWLTELARSHLLPPLHTLALEHRLPLRGASIRWAHSRWGSCSRRGTISLSARLLWLAPDEARYVMMHELTHLEHFHHGPAFWQALEARWPGAGMIDRRMRRQHPPLPSWLPLLTDKCLK